LARVVSRSLGFIGLTAATLIGFESAALGAKPLARREAMSRWSGRFGRVVLRLLGLELVRQGALAAVGRYPARSADGRGRVFVANHRSVLDVLVALAVADITFMSRHDVADWPLIGLAATRFGTVFVERGDRASGSQAIRAAHRLLEDGRAVIIFPEGTTYAGDEVRDFRFGAIRTAQLAGVEVVPLGLAYEDDRVAFGDESFPTHAWRIGGMRRIRLAVAAGEPLDVRQLSVEDATKLVRERVQALVREARATLS